MVRDRSRLLRSMLLTVAVVLTACTGDTGGTTTAPPISNTTAGTTRTTDVAAPPATSNRPGACDEYLAEEAPGEPGVLANDKVRVDLIGVERPTAYTISVHDETGWYQVAKVDPLARIAYDSPDSGPVTFDLGGADFGRDGDILTLTASATDPDGGTWLLRIDIGLTSPGCTIEVSSSLTVDQGRELLLFASPVLDAGAETFGGSKDTAVLGGLDWTVEGEESQAMAATPDPLDVAWPVMAVSDKGHLVGLMWDPLQLWDGSQPMPQPIFASPNWIEDKDSHLLGLAAPNVPGWIGESLLVDERDSFVKEAAAVPVIDRVTRSYPMRAGAELRIDAAIIADYPAEVPEAVLLYVDRFGLPSSPEFSLDDGLEAVIDSYLTTAWDPETSTWYQGTFGAKAPYITPVAQLATYADDAEPARATQALERIELSMGPVWQSSHDPGPSSAHMDFIDYGFRTGDAEEVLLWSAGSSGFSRGSQREDGSWGYSESDNICPGSLGDPGTSTLGTNAIHASVILEHARITRQEASIQAGMRALAHMDGFVKPAGAQVGEVPLAHGDPWAVAWAVRAYVEGYRVSGDEHHLDKAREWALKGIPFIYTWADPDHPVMPYSSIAVMGTSCWTNSWAGVAVQWVGLDYAASLLELASVDDSFPWSAIADGIARAGVGMLDTRAPTPADEWEEVVLTTTAPASTVGVGFSVRVNHELTIPGPTEFYVDDVSLVDQATGQNLILNGDFEAGGLNDHPWLWEANSVEMTSGGICRSGRCVHAVVGGDETLSAWADIGTTPVPGHVYELSLWVRLADDPPPTSGPLFRVEYFLDPPDARWVSIFARPLIGMLPDGYDIADQAGFAPILPERLGDVILGLRGSALHVRSEAVGDGDATYVVSGLADVSDLSFGSDGEIGFLVTPRTGPTSHLVVAMPHQPTSVTFDGVEVSTWRWAEETGLLLVTIEHSDDTTKGVIIR